MFGWAVLFVVQVLQSILKPAAALTQIAKPVATDLVDIV